MWGPQGEPGGGSSRLQHPLTLSSLCPDITGPIILQTYRAIADYEKSSGSEMALAMGDVVEVVEKGESGQPPALPCADLPPPLLGPVATSPCQGSALQAAPALLPAWPWGPDCAPQLWVTLPLSVHPGAAVGICTYCRLHCASLRVISRGTGQLLIVCVKWVPCCDSVTLCVGVRVILVWGVVKVTFLNPRLDVCVSVQVSSPS